MRNQGQPKAVCVRGSDREVCIAVPCLAVCSQAVQPFE